MALIVGRGAAKYKKKYEISEINLPNRKLNFVNQNLASLFLFKGSETQKKNQQT